MSAYRSLQLVHFRSYAEHSVQFNDGVNIIVGPNGSGKTNLLEALYVLSTGSSFRGQDKDLVRHGEDWLRLEARFGDQHRVLTYRVGDDTAEKQYVLDGAKKARLTHSGRVPVVLFEPDHLRLLRASPSSRRDYVDAILAKLQPDFTWLRHQFERVLAQRNNMLKKRLPRAQLEDQLFAWDIKFAELSEQLVARRRALLQTMGLRISDAYSAIANAPHQAGFTYMATVPGDDYRNNLLTTLHARLQHDVERGFTTIGPHRDDFIALLNGAAAAATASRGEVRSLLLAMKIIELRLLADQSDTPPLLMLDDVFSELDATRRRALTKSVREYQTFITTTDADAVTEHFTKNYLIITTR